MEIGLPDEPENSMLIYRLLTERGGGGGAINTAYLPWLTYSQMCDLTFNSGDRILSAHIQGICVSTVRYKP